MKRLLVIAAAVVIVAVLAIVWRTFGPASRTPSAVFITGVGERKTMDLPDGTRVTLGPASTLTLAHRYNASERRADLAGEAWFEVRHDASKPFRVHAFGAFAEDVGTSFTVRALDVDSTMRVIVADGVVAVRLEGGVATEAASLNAHDMVDLDARSLKAHIVRNVTVEPMISWRTGPAVYTDAPFGDVAADLRRWYGIVVQFERDATARRPVTYTMPTDNLEQALTALRTTLGVAFDRKGDTILVR